MQASSIVRKRTIMIVEDDPDIRTMLSWFLELEGFSVLTAKNGREAIERLHEHTRVSVILLDLMMPGMNGWQFRNAQQEDPALAEIPLVVISGDGAIAEKAAGLGAEGFLKKPIDLTTLLHTVERFC